MLGSIRLSPTWTFRAIMLALTTGGARAQSTKSSNQVDSVNAAGIPRTLTLDGLPIDTSNLSNRTPDMPLYTLQNLATGETRQVTDPGKALTTGLWSDVAAFRVPTMRGLAARPPYFHNGSAADLGAVVDFYNTRFTINFTTQERADLINFLNAL